MNIFITGSSGLIGGYIYRELQKIDLYNVVVINRELIPDLADSNTVHKLEKLGHADFLIHCAAKIPSPQINMDDVADINRKIDRQLFEYCKNTGTKIIFCSSMSVYERYGEDIVIDETMPILTNSDKDNYFQEKANSEKLFMGLDGTVIFRISSPYGINQKNKNVLKIFIENVKKNKDICYYGSGQRTQDFIHGRDIAVAVLCALKQNANGIFNIVSGESISMKQLAFAIVKLAQDYTGKICSNNMDDPQENFRANFSNKKADKLLGWKPSISLSAGITELL